MPADPPRTAIGLLIAYHVERERAYAAFLALIHPPADRAAAVSAAAASPAALAWLDQMVAPERAAPVPLPPFVELACAQATVPVRAFALSAAGVPAHPDRRADLAALASLAGRTARSLGSGAVAEAAHLNDLQCAFLRHHAHDCLDELSGQLLRWGGALHRRLGELMQQRLADDRAVLARS